MALIAGIMQLMTPAHANELAIGHASKTDRVIEIPVTLPVDLNFKTRDEVLRLRSGAVGEHLELLQGQYEPLPDIFRLVEDKKPWWGLYGLHVFRQGHRSIEGPSKESYYLLNPYMLVAAEPINIGIWDENKITEQDLRRPDFPFFWRARSIEFDPYNKIERITIECLVYNYALKAWESKLKKPLTVGGFSMIAYNARDFGFNYLYLDQTYSSNVKPWAKAEPVRITQMLHCGGSCGYPGGCNNMSPHIVELDKNQLKKTPARAYIKLWKEQPKDVSQPADFAVSIDFI